MSYQFPAIEGSFIEEVKSIIARYKEAKENYDDAKKELLLRMGNEQRWNKNGLIAWKVESYFRVTYSEEEMRTAMREHGLNEETMNGLLVEFKRQGMKVFRLIFRNPVQYIQLHQW